jgi:hypothetical protein
MAKKLSELLIEGRALRKQCRWALFDTKWVVENDGSCEKTPLSCDVGAIYEALTGKADIALIVHASDVIVQNFPLSQWPKIREVLCDLAIRNDAKGIGTEENIRWLLEQGL